jgi:transposase
MTGTTRGSKDTAGPAVLHVAFELDDLRWTLTMATGMGKRPRQRRVKPREREAVLREIEETKRRFGVGPAVRVVSCYEAGREGFWLHRWLESEGIENRVVDSASIEVNRRKRRVKADRLDGKKLLRLLIRHESGERGVWSVVRVPSVEAEDARHLHRELTALKRDRVRVTNRIKGLLATQGVRLEVRNGLPDRLEEIRLWDGSRLAPRLRARLDRAWEQRTWLTGRIQRLERERRELLRSSTAEAVEQVRQLVLLDGIGENSAWVFVTEFFGWRQFRNRREVGGLAGLTPTSYQSGATNHEQGISKAGNRHVRHMAVQVAWGWLRYQPDSELTRWWERKYGWGSSDLKKIGIVALARRLLIELWRYLETGAIPEGATVKAA